MTEDYPPGTDVQNLVDQAMAEAMGASEDDSGVAEAQPAAVDMPDMGGDDQDTSSATAIELLSDVDLDVKIELGRTHMLVEDVLRLGEGSVVELDKLAGDPVDVYVNERLVARGEVLVLNDNFCIRISEIIDTLAERQAEIMAAAGDAESHSA